MTWLDELKRALEAQLNDACGVALECADRTGLPQTVFYHLDWGYVNLPPGARTLCDPGIVMHSTWLPAGFFR